MTKIDDGGPAMPFNKVTPSGCVMGQFPGMTLRDWFAGQALGHGFTHVKGEDTPTDIAADAYAIADAMIAARNEPTDE